MFTTGLQGIHDKISLEISKEQLVEGYFNRGWLFLLCVIEINNELEVSISRTDVGFGNNRGRRLRLLQNPNEVFDICTNTSNKLFISILS